jgi:hypothetical protein
MLVLNMKITPVWCDSLPLEATQNLLQYLVSPVRSAFYPRANLLTAPGRHTAWIGNVF